MQCSVLLSVYYGETPKFLSDSLVSIWDNQTVQPDQIVLVKDGPLTQALEDVVEAWRLRLGEYVFTVVTLDQNVGLGAALNFGLRVCRCEFVARMDTDDVALSQRFEKQLTLLTECPDIAVVGGQIEEWDETLSYQLGVRRMPCDHAGIRAIAQKRSPLSHPSVMFRKSVIMSVGGYPALRKVQDYALWSLLLRGGFRLANHPDVLLRMRTGKNLLVRRGWEYFRFEAELLRFQRAIGFLSEYEYRRNLFLRGSLRLLPPFIMRLVYKFGR